MLLGISIHFITNWELISLLIGFEELGESHSGDTLSLVLYNILKKYNLLKSIGHFITDNGSNNQTMLVSLSRIMKSEDNIKINPLKRHIRCMCHIINLAINQLLAPERTINNNKDNNKINTKPKPKRRISISRKQSNNNNIIKNNNLNLSMISKVRSIIINIKSSSNKKSSFSKICKEKGMKYFSLKLDTPTRWSSTFEMLQRAMELKKAINQYIINYNLQTITSDEWDIIDKIIPVLEVFKSYSDYFQSDLPTIHMSISSYNKLFDTLDDVEYDGTCLLILLKTISD